MNFTWKCDVLNEEITNNLIGQRRSIEDENPRWVFSFSRFEI